MGVAIKAGEGLAKTVTHEAEGVAGGVSKVAKGSLDLAKGALTLNPQQASGGASEVGGGALEAGKNALKLTPEGLQASAVNQLLDGAVNAFKGSGSLSTAS